MRDQLPKKPWVHESGVINLHDSSKSGSHWVAYKKHKNKVFYFDSYGNLKPPIEVLKYFEGCEIRYNYERYQDFDSVECGHLCLLFLYKKQLPRLFKTV